MGLGVKHGILAAMIFSAVSALLTAQIQYVAVSVCEEMLRPHNASIDTDSNYIQSSVSSAVMSLNCTHPPHHMRDALSAKTAKAMQLVGLVNSLPGILVIGTMGVLSDAYGRKPILILGTASLLASAVITLVAVWFNLSWWYIAGAQAASGLTGNYVVVLLAIFASVSDISTGAERTINVAVSEGGVFLGAAAGSVAFGQLANKFPFDKGGGWQVMALTVALFAAALLWILFAMTETLSAEKRTAFPGLLKANTMSSVRALGRNRSTLTLTLAFCIQCNMYFGYLQVTQLYTENWMRWTPSHLAYFNMSTSIYTGVGMVLFIPLLGYMFKRFVPSETPFGRDRIVVLLAVAVGIVLWVLYGLVPQYPNPKAKWESFAIAVGMLIAGVQPPVMRAMFSKQFSASELGVVFGAIATVESVCQLVWPIVVEQIYSDSFNGNNGTAIDSWHGSIYFSGASLSALSFVVLLTLPKKTPELASSNETGIDQDAGRGVETLINSDIEPLLGKVSLP